MVYDKAIINFLLQRARADFNKGTNLDKALAQLRLMARNNQCADLSDNVPISGDKGQVMPLHFRPPNKNSS
ncbi:hypothetical protein O8B93_22045 [Agrobacterium rhizogenes]|uniref:hypothetical protein n=1 Tax=Rhizobium rhizogenes TaxID=359 RepID=UPI0022B6656D|nr:hypothetical protein [Rhizobium rhizogenes]MCZ7450270.1 hypothetical protein [Rhizobium rhizogenes]